jgi:hypothetical protein
MQFIMSLEAHLQDACLSAIFYLIANDVEEFGHQDKKFTTNPSLPSQLCCLE